MAWWLAPSARSLSITGRHPSSTCAAASTRADGRRSRPRFSPRRATYLRQGVAQAALCPSVRPNIRMQRARVTVAATVWVGGRYLLLACPREIVKAARAVDLPRHRVIGSSGCSGRAEISGAPVMVAQRCTVFVPDLFNPAKSRPIPSRGQRVGPQGHRDFARGADFSPRRAATRTAPSQGRACT